MQRRVGAITLLENLLVSIGICERFVTEMLGAKVRSHRGGFAFHGILTVGQNVAVAFFGAWR